MFERITTNKVAELLTTVGERQNNLDLGSLPKGQIIRIVTSRKAKRATEHVHLFELTDPSENTGLLIVDATEDDALRNGHEELIQTDRLLGLGYQMSCRRTRGDGKLTLSHPVQEIVLLSAE